MLRIEQKKAVNARRTIAQRGGNMANIKVAIINATSILSDSDIESVIQPLQKQVTRDFAPPWGVEADLVFVAKASNPPAGAWWLSILDDSDQADALGYHDLTAEGLPLGKVFANTDKKAGLNWTVTASHELLEMLADPDINLYAFIQTGGNTGKFYAYEVCDPCELDQQGYEIDGVQVSDFVYPAWFEGFRKTGSTNFDHKGLIDQPFKLLSGGYGVVMEIPSGLGWYQIDGPQPQGAEPRRQRAGVGSRRERRMTRGQWRRSEFAHALDGRVRGRYAQLPRVTHADAQSQGEGIWIPIEQIRAQRGEPHPFETEPADVIHVGRLASALKRAVVGEPDEGGGVWIPMRSISRTPFSPSESKAAQTVHLDLGNGGICIPMLHILKAAAVKSQSS
jgi:hypothetical protein